MIGRTDSMARWHPDWMRLPGERRLAKRRICHSGGGGTWRRDINAGFYALPYNNRKVRALARSLAIAGRLGDAVFVGSRNEWHRRQQAKWAERLAD